MTMNLDHLVDTANGIGEFFASMPDREAALNGIADHIRRFWDPRMRRALLDALASGQAPQTDALLPIVREAIERNRERLTPVAAPA